MTNKTQAFDIAVNLSTGKFSHIESPLILDIVTEALSALEQPRLETCPKCGGIADNGHDRELPPNPYLCSKCEQPAVSESDLISIISKFCGYKTPDKYGIISIGSALNALKAAGVLTNVIWEDGK